LNCEMIWEIGKKSKLNSEKIWNNMEERQWKDMKIMEEN
jgi:hypothetical protein